MVNASNKVLSRFNLADLTPKRSACSATITLKIKQYVLHCILYMYSVHVLSVTPFFVRISLSILITQGSWLRQKFSRILWNVVEIQRMPLSTARLNCNHNRNNVIWKVNAVLVVKQRIMLTTMLEQLTRIRMGLSNLKMIKIYNCSVINKFLIVGKHLLTTFLVILKSLKGIINNLRQLLLWNWPPNLIINHS
jgi:hypothetical protein